MFRKIYIEITNICNLNCKFCPATKRGKKAMNTEEFAEVIAKIKGYTNLVCLHVKGDPLLHNNLQDFLTILEANNLKCNITTNGVLLPEKVEILRNAKALRQLNISLHSAKQNNLDCKNYLNNVYKSVSLLEGKIISFRLWNLNSIKDNSINDEIIDSIETYYKIPNLKELLKEHEFIKIKEHVYINQDMEFTWPDITKDKIIDKGRCLALKEQLAILADGTVVPCCLDHNGDISLGNIFDESLEEILNKPLTKEIKEGFKNNKLVCKLCQTCGFLKRLEEKRK